MAFLKRKSWLMLLWFTMLAAVVVAVSAQVAQRFPTYEYYGRVLSMDEFLKLVETGQELHCVQLPSVEVYLDDRATSDYACFNTEAERDAHAKRLDAEWERITQEYPTHS